jgi:adenylate kinase
MLNIVLFGAPGAGKGTQAELLLKKYALIHLSTGDMLRSEISRDTERGKLAKQLIDKGNLVPDSMVVEMIEEKIRQNKSAKGFIFDGFPRTIPQAEMLDRMLTENGLHIHLVAALDNPEDELVRRLLNRGKIPGRADDQNESIIRDRIAVYHEKTAPLIGYYKAQGKYVSVDGTIGIENVFNELCAIIDRIKI